jgi:FkbM family methyltransferase
VSSDLERDPIDRLERLWLAFLRRAPQPAVKLAAAAAARTRPLELEPSWRFDFAAGDPRALVRFRRDLWEYYRRHGIEKPVTLRWYDGLRVRSYLGNDMSLCLYVGGAFEPNEFVFLDSVLREGATFIDGGANDGIHSLFAAHRVGPTGTVIAVEPSSREYARLLENIRINELSIAPVRAALGREAGEATLAVAESGHEGQNTIGDTVSNPTVRTVSHERVPKITVDQLVSERDVRRVDVIKLDVEGSEIDALVGARTTIARDRPLVLLEAEDERLASQGMTKADLRSIVDEIGYELHVFDQETGRLRPAVAPDEPEGNAVAAPPDWVPPSTRP